MVFETVVVDVLNRFLGDYVENLDRSQLQLRIWGGDVVLNDLVLKPSALNDLDLPVNVVAGHLGQLVLKIPWTNLYSAPVIVQVEGLYLLVVPHTVVKYDAEREALNLQAVKQKQLRKIEEAAKVEAEASKNVKSNDSFVEKLTTQIIRNVQITVKNIHLRYEDNQTCPSQPFSLGITLDQLSMETTDEHWVPCLADENVKLIHKMLSVESFAVYWNSFSQMLHHLEPNDRKQLFCDEIARKNHKPDGFKYVLGPINCNAKLKMNPKPETDGSNYTIPKIFLDLEMEEIAIGLTKYQYRDLMEMLQSFEWMARSLPYRKYKPEIAVVHGHAKTWWHFAYASVLGEIVKRRRRNWSWDHMKDHLSLCRVYHSAYYTKLTCRKLAADVAKQIEECEQILDVFNIVLIRKRVEVEAARAEKKLAEENANKGWFGGWFGWGKKDTSDTAVGSGATEIVKKFEEALTPDEKKKMYAAIGYQENAVPAIYPPTYVQNSLQFLLHNLHIVVSDEDLSKQEILQVDLKNVRFGVEQRPAADALKVEGSIDDFIISGISDDKGERPKLVHAIMGKEQQVLLKILFETNPLDGHCDQLIHVSTLPIQIIYHACTILQLPLVFKAPPSVQLSNLQAAAASKLEEFKEMSATGLQHVIEEHRRLDLKIDLMSSRVLVPFGGTYMENCSAIVMNLGSIHIASDVLSAQDRRTVSEMHNMGSTEAEIMSVMLTRSYDKFSVELNDFQILFALQNEDWLTALSQMSTPLHLVHPTTLAVRVEQSLIRDNPQIPQTKISGHLPSICLHIPEKRLLEIAALLSSLPSIEMDVDNPEIQVTAVSVLPAIPEEEELILGPPDTSHISKLSVHQVQKKSLPSEKKDVISFVEMILDFKIGAIEMKVLRTVNGSDSPLASFSMHSFTMDFKKCTYDMAVSVTMGGIQLQHYSDDKITNLLQTTATSNGNEDPMLRLKYVNVDHKSPEFRTVYQSVAQNIEVHFTTFLFTLHDTSLLDLLQFSNHITARLEEIQQQKERAAVPKGLISRTISQGSLAVASEVRRRVQKKPDIIQLKLDAHLSDLCVKLTTARRCLIDASIKGVEASVEMRSNATEVHASLKDLLVCDPRTDSEFPKILSIFDEEALQVKIISFSETNDDKVFVSASAVDLSVELTVGGSKIVFLNRFVSDVMAFVNQFQAAKQALVDASAAAAEAAKQNMANAYAKAFRIALNINLKAPIIIMPQNSCSEKVIVVDLGHLVLQNSFELHSQTNEIGTAPVLDKIQLKLKNLQIARAVLDGKLLKVVSECLLLEPISFELSVVRNLSIDWFKDIPECTITGRLEPLQVACSEEDYAGLMLILSENIGEQGDGITVAEADQMQTNADVAVTKGGHEKIDEELSALGIVYKKVVFRITFEEMGIMLYKGSSSLKGSQGVVGRNQSNALCNLVLHLIAIEGEIISNNSMWAHVLLDNCTVDDLRVDRQEGIRRFMEKKITGPEPSNMLDVMYMDKSQSQIIHVRIFSFQFVLHMGFVTQLLNFVNSGNTNKPEAKPLPVKHDRPKLDSQISQIASTVSATMTVDLQIEQPDLILVEDLEDLNTNALIVQNEIVVKFRISGTQQSLNASLSKLQIYTCCFHPDKRESTKCTILMPCALSVIGTTHADQGWHLDVSLSDIILEMSPATIELLSNVSSSFSVEEKKVSVEELSPRDWSNIWGIKKFEESNYWFLKPEEGQEAIPNPVRDISSDSRREQILMKVPNVILVLAVGVGNKTMPLLRIESTFSSEVFDWSSHMKVNSQLSLQIVYFNSRHAIWEPLLEPVEAVTDGNICQRQWELSLEITSGEPTPPSQESIDSEEFILSQPKLNILLTSQDMLELTVTKTCMDVLMTIGEAFQEAVKKQQKDKDSVPGPYLVKNDTEYAVTLLMDSIPFKLANGDTYSLVKLEAGGEIYLTKKEDPKEILSGRKSILFEQENKKDGNLDVQIDEMEFLKTMPILRADKRHFALPRTSPSGDHYGLILDITTQNGCKIVTLRSAVQIMNHLEVPVSVYYMSKRSNELVCEGEVQPGKSLNLSMRAVYTNNREIFFSAQGYTVASTPIVWKRLLKDASESTFLQCRSRDAAASETFCFKAIGEVEYIYNENSHKQTMGSRCINIHLRPTVIFKNHLPLTLVYKLHNMNKEKELQGGQAVHLTAAALPSSSDLRLRIEKYLNEGWSCTHSVQSAQQELDVWTFKSENTDTYLELGMHTAHIDGSMIMSLYSPFWMINKTGLMLTYRKSRKKRSKAESVANTPKMKAEDQNNFVVHPADFSGPVLFSFRGKAFFGKKKATLRVDDGDWSDKFSLDAAGSGGIITCTTNGLTREIGMQNQLSNLSLTKLLIFAPRYVISNKASFTIECKECSAKTNTSTESSANTWTEVPSNECIPYWPHNLSAPVLCVRVKGTVEESVPFAINMPHASLLQLDNKYGGLNIDCYTTESSTYVSIEEYAPGMAPFKLINHTPFTISYQEKDVDVENTLQPYHESLYSWKRPTGKCFLTWECRGIKCDTDVYCRDACGVLRLTEDVVVYYTSFLDGIQRILLFTSESYVATNCQDAKEWETIDREVVISLHGVGLSLTDNVRNIELSYMAINSSGVVWEGRKYDSNRFKPFSFKDSALIEEAYQKYIMNTRIEKVGPGSQKVSDKIEVDFGLEEMKKPYKRRIRRSFQVGLWLQQRSSTHQNQIHLKVNRLQIDNQLADSVFPIVFAPVPPPKSVATEGMHKPFAEVSIMQRNTEHCSVTQFKYFKVLIQEFHIKLDQGFINGLMEFFAPDGNKNTDESALHQKDLDVVHSPLKADAALQSSQEAKNYYDVLHFSPLKVHVSFSMGGSSGSQKPPEQLHTHFLNLLLQSVGLTVTEIQDVVFRLAYFERAHTLLTQKQLVREVTVHYTGQAVKQLYVLVLGLDVLGNPFSLVLDITKGVEDLFYEPIQGAIQGPGEFAEGLALGMRSLVGHTVGGAAGAVSKITGTLGKGLAALTFDEDFQKKRRQGLNQQPADLREGLARSGKGLVMGVVDGVSGVITKPITGAKEEGVEGFFKGIGKGVVGLVTRPTAGVFDFASGSLDAVKRVADVNEEARRLRPPRFLRDGRGVRPYSNVEAEGWKLFRELEKGRYLSTDKYVAHAATNVDGKSVLLVTDRRLFVLKRNDIFGQWQVEWQHRWEEIGKPPVLNSKGLVIELKQSKKVLGLFSGDNEKVIPLADRSKWIAQKVVDTFNETW